MMAELFQTTKQNISLHIDNILQSSELQEIGTVKENLTVHQEGTRQVQRKVKFYNLDMIISVGYRVNSVRGTHTAQEAKDFAKEQYQAFTIRRQLADVERAEQANARELEQQLRAIENKKGKHP